ncbi:hypothetical protein PROFUN_09358 [Planoprotostelium fungivorum]|uniref:Uncharacterized protein n=1 Tax=Planoprotostelium fungivorum TaxID=1890364 RepID=A0A2P6NGW6_9EUKA|nr:hypothetical protein PROFUN_09358 [Planoprotostelium fungivorum]
MKTCFLSNCYDFALVFLGTLSLMVECSAQQHDAQISKDRRFTLDQKKWIDVPAIGLRM